MHRVKTSDTGKTGRVKQGGKQDRQQNGEVRCDGNSKTEKWGAMVIARHRSGVWRGEQGVAAGHEEKSRMRRSGRRATAERRKEDRILQSTTLHEQHPSTEVYAHTAFGTYQMEHADDKGGK